jgi:anoctamin-1
MYTFVAQYLTEMELHRTQSEFDDSLILKIYVLQFVNYYSSIFYIAFFKGKFLHSPNIAPAYLGEERVSMSMNKLLSDIYILTGCIIR